MGLLGRSDIWLGTIRAVAFIVLAAAGRHGLAASPSGAPGVTPRPTPSILVRFSTIGVCRCERKVAAAPARCSR